MSNVGGVSLPTGPCGTMHAGCTGAALQRQLGASGLALAARTTVALLNLKVQSFEESPQAKFVSLRTIMAGAMLLVGHSHVVQRASRIAQRGSGRLPADPQNSRMARMARQYHGEPASSGGAERLLPPLFCRKPGAP